jgi:5'-nucleotidase
VQVFDVNVTNPPSGDGMSLWTVSYDEVIGVATDAVVQGSQDARLREVATGDLVADALRTHYGTELAFVNGGGVGPSLPGGYAPADTTLRRPQNGYTAGPPYDLVVGDAYTLAPFSNLVVTRTVTGAQLWAMLENGFSVLPVAHGRFPQISGFRVVYDVELPAGARVVSVTLDGGAPIVADATTYTIALPDFLNNGGDFYSMLNDGTGTLRDLMPAVVAEYIATAGTITPTTDGRITEQ